MAGRPPGRIATVGHGTRGGPAAYVALALGLRVADHRVRAVTRGDLPAVDPPMGRWPRPTILDRLTALAAIDAIAGQEQPLVAYLRGALAPVCDEVTVDAVGNLYAVRRGPREQERSAVRPHTEMSVDVGADSAASVAAMGIAVGDPSPSSARS